MIFFYIYKKMEDEGIGEGWGFWYLVDDFLIYKVANDWAHLLNKSFSFSFFFFFF